MKLVNRVSLFFLAALAVVLIAYSSIFYAIVRARLVRQFEQESHGTLNSLVAAIEVEPEEVKWQPLEHTIALGADQGPDEVRWIVIGDGTHLVDKSRNATSELVAQARSIAANTSTGADGDKFALNGDWRLLHRRLFAPAPDRTERELDEFDEIVVVVAHSSRVVKRQSASLAGFGVRASTWGLVGGCRDRPLVLSEGIAAGIGHVEAGSLHVRR